MKYRLLLLIGCLCLGVTFGQEKREWERRIERSEFPDSALELIIPYLDGANKIKFYLERDQDKRSYEVKLKKRRLRYSIEFDQHGVLEDVEVRIREVDIPNESFEAIRSDLGQQFSAYRIRKIQQQYPNINANPQEILKKAFQNLLIPELNYEIIIAGKEAKRYQTYEFLYNAEGGFLNKRIVRPIDKDHVLY